MANLKVFQPRKPSSTSASPFVSIATQPPTQLSARVSENIKKKERKKTKQQKILSCLALLGLKSCGAQRLTLAAFVAQDQHTSRQKPPCTLAGRCSRTVPRRRAATVTLQRTEPSTGPGVRVGGLVVLEGHACVNMSGREVGGAGKFTSG